VLSPKSGFLKYLFERGVKDRAPVSAPPPAPQP
jgi:hypothetical protein